MEKAPPHVLIFPFPAQGHINSMLGLAKLLCLAGIQVTFLNTEHTHHRLLRSNPNLLAGRPGLRFHTISDGLALDHPRSVTQFMDFYESFISVTKPLLRAMLAGSGGRLESDDKVTCIVADGIFSFAIDVADELGIPAVAYRTVSACSFWAYFCGPALIEGGEFPFEGKLLASTQGFLLISILFSGMICGAQIQAVALLRSSMSSTLKYSSGSRDPLTTGSM